SSGFTLDDGGLYTAGANTDTVDHLLMQALLPDGSTLSIDQYVVVDHPRSASPVPFGGPLGSGDFNGDGLADLLQRATTTTATDLGLLLGGSVGPARGADLYLPVDVGAVKLADVDGDGRTDLLAVNHATFQGGASTPACPIRGAPACFTDGTVPSENAVGCAPLDGGLLECGFRLYPAGGGGSLQG